MRRLALYGVLLLSLTLGQLARAAEWVTLSPANHAEFAPKGKEAEAVWGDYVIRNDKLVAAVADATMLTGRSAGRWAITNVSGALIDLTRRDDQHDLLNAYYPAKARFKADAPEAQALFTDDSTIWQAPGRAGEQGATVTLTPSPYELESGKSFEALDKLPAHLRGAPRPWVKVSYTLADGQEYLLVTSEYHNPLAQPFKHQPFSFLRVEGEVTRGKAYDERLNYAWDPWWGAAYGVYDAGAEPAAAREGNTLTLPAKGVVTLRSKVFVARDLATLLAQVAADLGQPTATVKLTVKDASGAPVPEALISVRVGGQPAGQAKTNAAGVWQGAVRAGDLALSVNAYGYATGTLEVAGGTVPAAGQAPGQHELAMTLATPARVVLSIRDGTGQGIPAKVQFFGQQGTASPDFFPNSGAERARNVAYTANGQLTQVLPPGSYLLQVSRGPEYEALRLPLTLAPGATETQTLTLKRVLDTSGWISAEFHNHSTLSGYLELFYIYPYTKDALIDGASHASPRGRVLNLLAEGIEFAPATEHNYSYSYQPLITELGASAWLKSVAGVGMTAGRRHTVNHQNAFPVPWTPGRMDGGILQRPEHIGQLQWLQGWPDGTAPAFISVAHAADQPLSITKGVVLELLEIEPIFAGKPLPLRDPHALNWLAKLGDGYRLTAVAGSGRYDNFNGSGELRNWVASSTDDPAALDPLAVARSAMAGQVVLSTGPFLTVSASAGEQRAGPGDLLVTKDGVVTLNLRVQCAPWITLDQVQVWLNEKPVTELDFKRMPAVAGFSADGHGFERQVPLKVTADTRVLVLVAGNGWDLHPRIISEPLNRRHLAISNPLFIDFGGDGLEPHSPLDDAVTASLEFISPIMVETEAPPARIRLWLKNTGDITAVDEATLEFVPPGIAQVIGSATQRYEIPPGGERWLDFEARFTPEWLKANPVARSTYNNANRFGIFVGRAKQAPGRAPARKHMELGFWLATGPALAGLDAVDAYLAETKPFPLSVRGDDAGAGELRWALAGNDLAVSAKIRDPRPSRREPLWDSTCLEIFGCLAARSPSNTEVPGGHYPVRQLYLLPAIGAAPAVVLHRAKDKVTEIKDIKFASRQTADGYEIRALIPLSRLELDFDLIQRQHYSYNGYAPKSLLGILPATADARLEARVNRLSPTGATERSTIFGSPAPHVDNHAFGVFRQRPPVSVSAKILAPVPINGTGAGRVEVTILNRTARPVSDHMTWLLHPATVAKVDGASEFDLTLAPGEMKQMTLDLPSVPAKSLLSQVELQLRRSPANSVVAQVLANVPVAARPLMTLPAGVALASVPEALRSATPLPLQAGELGAVLRLALNGEHLAIHAIIPDSQVMPHETQPWKGSCLELYGSPNIGTTIGQLLLVPNAKGEGAVVRRPVDKGFPVVDAVPAMAKATADGYEIWALLPRALLAVPPGADELLLEAQLTTFAKDAKLVRGTFFGSPRAYQGSHHYGAFRAAKAGSTEGQTAP